MLGKKKFLINKQGFTLIEIIVVLIILGVLASIAVPSLYGWIERSRAVESVSLLKSLNDQLSTCVKIKSLTSCAGSLPFNIQNTAHFVLDGHSRGTVGTEDYWMLQVYRNNVEISNDPGGVGPTCSGSMIAGVTFGGMGGAHSKVALCHNFDGDGKNKIVGEGLYKGVF